VIILPKLKPLIFIFGTILKKLTGKIYIQFTGHNQALPLILNLKGNYAKCGMIFELNGFQTYY